ncbi:RND family efflux transporter, MFP subunit [Roseovarius azorensis]|uniref:RND family efflux transporter, MFP subunit n=1 Tax=Roseovarius azorensis TaxID=1287727 RepID=A0A1H7UJ57_9RHOB|nr:HlyD family efflux transporter periplasmic adaptor subunit [Roseovarius azorensis]SEL96839.1 RND family efflux transporter, MFP subunit [Roseovarius azorensis]
MRFLRQGLTGLFLLSLTLGLLAYAGQTIMSAIEERLSRETRVPERRERVFAVRTTLATEATITPELTAFGQIQSRRTLEIRAQATGTITELSPDFIEGGQVRAGQFLARIDPADAQSALDRARTDLMDARAEEREAARALTLAQDELAARRDQAALQERALARQRDLESRGVGTLTAVETAEYNVVQARQAVLAGRQALAQAEARVDQAATAAARAKLALSEAERRLAETRINAGFSGTLSDVTLVAGRLVSANEQLARLVDGTALEVAFRVSTPQYARLLDDSGALLPAPVTATLDAFGLDLTATGTVTRQSAAVGEGQTGRLIFATLDSAPAMKPGDFVTVTVEEPRLERVVHLPADALGPDGTVLVLDTGDRLEALPVNVLRRQGNDVLVRGEGLSGRAVVRDRTPVLGPGIKVRPLPTAPDEETDEETVTLTPDRRARLVAYVESSPDMPDAVKQRLLAQLGQPQVPAQMVERLERRIGG